MYIKLPNFYKIFRYHIVKFVDIIYPKKCIICHESVIGILPLLLCPKCWTSLDFILPPYCAECGEQLKKNEQCKCTNRGYTKNLDGIIVALRYKGAIKKLIYNFKYNKKISYGHLFADLLIRNIIDVIIQDNIKQMIIVPIPLHKKRLRNRGYNQSAILAQKIYAKILAYKYKLTITVLYNDKIIKRIENNRNQAGLKLIHRKHNVKGIFAMNNKNIDDMNQFSIFLIDDIITSGATINECANVLKNNGATKIYGVGIARAYLGNNSME